MFTKEDFLNSVADEQRILTHIHKKIDAAHRDYRPGESRRSTLELMQYLTICGRAPAKALVGGDWSIVKAYQDDAQTMSFDEFPARLEAQTQEIKQLVEPVSGDAFGQAVTLPWGAQSTLGRALVETSLMFLTAYRLQLFNHAKANQPSLNTMDAWLGMDAPTG